MKPEGAKPLPEHLPAPSFAPPLLAVGLMLLFWGAISSWLISAAGLLLTGFAGALWITDLRPRALREAAPTLETVRKPVRAAHVVPSSTRFLDVVAANPWVYRCALALAISTLAVVVTGAIVTSEVTPASSGIQSAHLVAGALTGVFAIALAFWIRPLGWILLLALAVEVTLGNRALLAACLHALLAQFFFSGSIAVALLTSPGWRRVPALTDDMARPSLRLLCSITLALVVIQVTLGALVRHKIMGAGLHITFALVVALMLVILGVLVCNQCAAHRILRPCAIAMMVIAGTQVFLGFGAFIVRMMADEGSVPLVITTVAHVTTGALTLAATVVLTFQLHRHLRPAPAPKGAVVP